MFLFITSPTQIASSVISFKYILCSYLSYFNLRNRIFLYDSNTSYVLIYRLQVFQKRRYKKFKYILCSYLSSFRKYNWNQNQLFKYILCSYLSMEMFVYHALHYNSNTSYVLIYLPGTQAVPKRKIIQIHLMFLFIYYG